MPYQKTKLREVGFGDVNDVVSCGSRIYLHLPQCLEENPPFWGEKQQKQKVEEEKDLGVAACESGGRCRDLEEGMGAG